MDAIHKADENADVEWKVEGILEFIRHFFGYDMGKDKPYVFMFIIIKKS